MSVLSLASSTICAQSSQALDEQPADSCGQITYTVKSGDMLHRIASSFGSYRFWEIIYVTNAHQMANPNLIYPGQELIIPLNVANFETSGKDVKTVLSNPFCEPSTIPIDKVNEDYLNSKEITELLSHLESMISKEVHAEEELQEDKTAQLEKLRELFSKVVEEQKEAKEQEESAQQKTEKELLQLMDGMVYDETRSKIGRDFYDIFYRNWEAPEKANNYSIKVVETPGPSLGTVVSVFINNSEIFKTRLQPRYETIEDAGKYAVQVTYNYLLRNSNQQAQIFY